MQTKLSILLQNKGSSVHSVAPTASVLEAVQKMNQERIGALLVRDHGQVVGIFTERDVLCRVVDEGRDPGTTRVAQVMTNDVVTVGPEISVEEAMAVVTDKRCRHLPVMDDDDLLGLISIGDLTRWVARNQAHHIRDLVNYITGRYPV
jgi:CBS domain-containing protein